MLIVQDRRFRYDNQALYLSPVDDRIGHVFAERAPESEQAAIWATLDAVQSGELPEARVEFESEVTHRILEALLRPTTYEGHPAVAVYMRNVTERATLVRSLAEQAQELAETIDDLSLYRRMFELSRDNIILIQDGVVQLSNGALREAGAASIVGRRMREVMYPDDYERINSTSADLFSGEVAEARWEHRYPSNRPPGYRTMEAVARGIDYRGRPALLVNTRDISERKAVEIRLEELTRTDALTNIANRRAFYEALAYWRDEAARSKATHAVCYIDLDRFKSVNDTHGHRAGGSSR
jgi:PAS domain S-box-containing protein